MNNTTKLTNVLNIKTALDKQLEARTEMHRLKRLYRDGIISKARAFELFQSYLELNYGRQAHREYQYKIAS